MGNIPLNERIKKARLAKNWTKLELANALNVNVKNVSRWELGQNIPNLDAAALLARVLGISLDFLGGLDNKGANDPLVALLTGKLSTLSKEQKNALKTVLNAF